MSHVADKQDLAVWGLTAFGHKSRKAEVTGFWASDCKALQMSELIGFFLEIFAGAAPRRGEYGKAFIATVAAIILMLVFVAGALSFLTLAG